MTTPCIHLEEKMQVHSFALKGAVLLAFLSAPAHANQSRIEWIKSKTIKQIAEFELMNNHENIVKLCRFSKILNKGGESIFSEFNSNEYLKNMSKRSNMPFDVVKKYQESINYAMYFVCPDVY